MDNTSLRYSTKALLRAGVGLGIAYAPYYVNPLFALFGVELPLPDGPPAILILNWTAVVALLAYMRFVEDRRLSEIGLSLPSSQDIKWALFFWGIANGVTVLAQFIAPPPPSDGLDTLLNLSIAVLSAMIITTAITEEILYKGYSIEALTQILRHRWLAVVISFSLFAAPHLSFFGVEWIFYHGASPVLAYILYIWRRNLWACMLMHGLGNAMILVPALGLVEA